MTDIRSGLEFHNDALYAGAVSSRTKDENIGDVRSLQRKLRNISSYYEEIPLIQADGIFGESTEDALLKFQELFGLERTGIVNFDTWNKVVEISEETDRVILPSDSVLIFNEGNVPINPGDKDNQLYVIQAMILALAEVTDNIKSPDITGIHDRNSVEAVKSVQLISGLDDNGIIDVEFVNNLGQLYEVYITRERLKNKR